MAQPGVRQARGDQRFHRRRDLVFPVETRVGEPLMEGKGRPRGIDDDAAVDDPQPVRHTQAHAFVM